MSERYVRVIEHRKGRRLASKLALLAAALLLAFAFDGGPRTMFLWAAGLSLLAGLPLRMLAARSSRGVVTASARGLAVNGRIVCPAHELTGGGFGKVSGKPCLSLFDGRGEARFQVFVSAQAADRLLESLRPGLRPEAVDFGAISRALATKTRLASLVAYSVGAIGVFVMVIDSPFFWAGLLLFAPVLVMAFPSRIRVGADGVSIRWLLRDRFVPFAELDEVADIPHGALLVHRGTRIPIVVTDAGQSDPLHRGDALRRAIRHGYERHRQRSGAAAARLLARRGRDPGAWLEELEQLDTREGYREVSLTLEALKAVLDNPAAPVSARRAAALLLGKRGLDDPARETMRATARTAASPALRAALEVVADDGGDAERVIRRLSP